MNLNGNNLALERANWSYNMSLFIRPGDHQFIPFKVECKRTIHSRAMIQIPHHWSCDHPTILSIDYILSILSSFKMYTFLKSMLTEASLGPNTCASAS